MSSSSGELFSFLQDTFNTIFGGKKPEPPAHPPMPPDNLLEPAQIVNNRVLLIVYDPVMDQASGTKLARYQSWNRIEELTNVFMADILQVSGGMARYQIAKRIELNEFPAKIHGFRFSPQMYKDVLAGAASPHMSQEVDYHAILAKFNIIQQVFNNEIDEVWIFAFPHAGFYESVMAGKGAFWCNAPALINTGDCPRRFIIMGFSYERGVGEMLENFGHRSESIMTKIFEHLNGEANPWQRFTRTDITSPGIADIGTIHFAPNSDRDYDWNNPRFVPSNCHDWFNFPNLRGDVRLVNASEWGSGDIRLHHKWWLKHIPHVAGRINGIHNNWWQYIMDVNRIRV